jgi:hypothetical protein
MGINLKGFSMGSGFGIRCVHCGFNKKFRLGIGKLYIPEYIFVAFILDGKPMLESLVRDKGIKEQAFSILREKKGVPSDEYGHELYYCHHCHELCERFYFRITYDECSFEPEYKCRKCKIKLHRVKENVSDGKLRLRYRNNKPVIWECPKCGGKALSENVTMTFWWD